MDEMRPVQEHFSFLEESFEHAWNQLANKGQETYSEHDERRVRYRQYLDEIRRTLPAR